MLPIKEIEMAFILIVAGLIVSLSAMVMVVVVGRFIELEKELTKRGIPLPPAQRLRRYIKPHSQSSRPESTF